ncbi:MAG: hypothetical protein IKR47_05720 [Lachnospiraceae bacterium]|nr:hypothetical protein [Lachnospiraceae bacterium]
MSDKDIIYSIPDDYKPISMWGYFWYQILFSIPVIGTIILIFKAIGASNKNVRNFARSYFCVLVLVLIIAGILLATGVLAGIMG